MVSLTVEIVTSHHVRNSIGYRKPLSGNNQMRLVRRCRLLLVCGGESARDATTATLCMCILGRSALTEWRKDAEQMVAASSFGQ